MHMTFRCLREDLLQQLSEEIISLLESQALKLGMASKILSRSYNIASVRRIQLGAASNTLVFLGVEESNALLMLRGEDGKRLVWRDDFRSKVRKVYNIKGMQLLFGLMTARVSDLNTLWICAIQISTGRTVWRRFMHKSKLNIAAEHLDVLAHWSSQDAIVATCVYPETSVVALWAWKVHTGQEILYQEIGHGLSWTTHTIRLDISETNDSLCIGGTRGFDGEYTLTLWSLEKIRMQAAFAEQHLRFSRGKSREELQKPAHEWFEAWLQRCAWHWSAFDEEAFQQARFFHLWQMHPFAALQWHTTSDHGTLRGLRCVAGMVYGSSVKNPNILIGWDGSSEHHLFTKSFRHPVNVIVASGELLVVGTAEERGDGDVVSMNRKTLDEKWRIPHIGCIQTLLPVGIRLYGCCHSTDFASVFALVATTGDLLFWTDIRPYIIGDIHDLLHEGGLLFVCLRTQSMRNANTKYGIICGVEAKRGKKMWDKDLAKVNEGFTACAT